MEYILDERLSRPPSPVDPVLDAVIRAVFGMSEQEVLVCCGVEPTPDAVFLDHVSIYALRAWKHTLRAATKHIKNAKHGRSRTLSLTHLTCLCTDAATWPVREERAKARRAQVDYITGQSKSTKEKLS